jgi:outer membrane protein TolC
MRFKISLFLLISSFIIINAKKMSEKDIIIIALEKNPDIKLLNSREAYGLLDLKIAEAGWLPQIGLSSTYQPLIYDYLKFHPLKSDDYSWKIFNSAVLSKILPGGGTIYSTFYQGIEDPTYNNENYSHQTKFSASINQPLLKDAFSNAPLTYSLTIKKLDYKNITLDNQKQILSDLSNIRNLYWDYYSQKSLLSIYDRKIERAEEHRKIANARFAVGDGTILDTLSSAYELMSSMQRRLDAQINLKKTLRQFSLSLSLPPDSLTIDSIPFNVPSLPSSQELIDLSFRYDPSLRIFENMERKLAYQYKNQTNNLLPSLDLNLSYSNTHSGSKLFSSNQSNRNAIIGLVFSYALPLKKEKIEMKQTELSQKDNLIRKEKYTAELTSKLNELRDSWSQELQRIALLEKSKNIAELQLNAAQNEFKQGTIDRMALLDAEDKLVESETNLLKANFEMKKLEIILDEITGTLFQRFGISTNE